MVPLHPHSVTRLVRYFSHDYKGRVAKVKDWKFCARKGSDYSPGKALIKIFHRPSSKTKFLKFSLNVHGVGSTSVNETYHEPSAEEIEPNEAGDWVLVFVGVVTLNVRGKTFADVKISYEREKVGHSGQSDKEKVALASDIKSLFLSSESSDVVLEVGDEKIPAHQLILSTRSSYFKGLFASGTSIKKSFAYRTAVH